MLFTTSRLSVAVASPYEILQIDPDADESEIRRAYRRRAKETHPDGGGSAREFQRVREAYEEITASDRRVDAFEDGLAGGSRRRNGTRDRPGGNDSRVEYLNYDVLCDHGWTLEDEDLFEKAAVADLDPADHGRFVVEPHECLLESAENRGFAWPYSCRGGACANCAVAVVEGDLSMPVNHVLPPEMTERGIRLSCVGAPISDELKVVYNVKHLPDLDELRLPPGPFREAHLDD